MKSAKDHKTIKESRKDEVKGEGEDSKAVKKEFVSSLKAAPATPIRGPRTKKEKATKSISGSKRKRARSETPEAEAHSEAAEATEAETSSGSDMNLTITPLASRSSLRVRTTRAAALTTQDDEDNEIDAGAKDDGSGYSDEEYDFAEERRMRAKLKAKK